MHTKQVRVSSYFLSVSGFNFLDPRTSLGKIIWSDSVMTQILSYMLMWTNAICAPNWKFRQRRTHSWIEYTELDRCFQKNMLQKQCEEKNRDGLVRWYPVCGARVGFVVIVNSEGVIEGLRV
jgi:hypothetical protein